MKVLVECNTVLSREAFHRCGGPSSGRAHWWLRLMRPFPLPVGEWDPVFVRLPRAVRGDDPFRQVLDLRPGMYCLGTGVADEEIRHHFPVWWDEAECELPLTEPEPEPGRIRRLLSFLGLIQV